MSDADNTSLDLSIVTTSGEANAESVPGERTLIAYAEAVIGRNADAIKSAAAALRAELGDAALVDCAAVVAHFDAINRVADATGIELDNAMNESTADMRAQLGFDKFDTRAD